ncbi:MAG: hypothetical protein ACM3ZE_03740 [Myxococcales bacterium]
MATFKSTSLRRGCWAALTVLGCSVSNPPTTPAAGIDSGQELNSAGAANTASPMVDPISKLPPPQKPNPRLWLDVARPTPGTINLSRPGGDAPDPHAAAMVRLLEEPFGELKDKDNQVVLSYPDSSNWKRVRYRLFEHLVGFRYGDHFDSTVVVLAYDTRAGRTAESRSCIRQAETMVRPRLRAFSVAIGPITETEIEWQGKRVVVHSVDGAFPWGFKRIEFTAAWAAYPAYEHACLIHGIGVRHEERVDLAHAVRDRWILDVAPNLETRTSTKPYRH